MSDELIAQLADSDWRVRQKAAKELGALADPRSEVALVQALSDEKAEVWQTAEKSLGQLSEPVAARLLAYEARAKKLTDPKLKLSVILPLTDLRLTAINAQSIGSVGSYSFQLPQLCVYCGAPVGQHETVRAEWPQTTSVIMKQKYFQAPCCARHQVEAQRNGRINFVFYGLSFIVSLAATWWLAPRVFADVSVAGQVIFGFLTVVFATAILGGLTQDWGARVLARLSPAYASLLAMPGAFDGGCIGLKIGSGANSALRFEFANPQYGARFYATSAKAVLPT